MTVHSTQAISCLHGMLESLPKDNTVLLYLIEATKTPLVKTSASLSASEPALLILDSDATKLKFTAGYTLQGIPEHSGVYMFNLPLDNSLSENVENTVEGSIGKQYIGSASNMFTRLDQHIDQFNLKRNPFFIHLWAKENKDLSHFD